MADPLPKLTEGILPKIFRKEVSPGDVQPILQILAVKAITNDSGRRYRFLISDGRYNCQLCIMLGQEDIMKKMRQGELEKFGIIKLNSWSINSASESKKVLIMLDPQCMVKGAEVGSKIGNSQAYDPSEQPPVANGVSSTTPSDPPYSSNSRYGGGGGGNTAQGFQEASRRDSFGFAAMDQSIREDLICPISQITPYQNKWAIRGRCTNKGGKKHWNNAKGEGTLFSFTLQDDSGEIRITAFKHECDKYFDLIEVDQVYCLSRAIVKPSNKRFSTENHDYELSLTGDSIVQMGDSSDASCPQIKYNFLKIKEIESMPPESLIDVVGVISDPGTISSIHSTKLQKELKKRDISLVDDSENEVKLTIWNDEAERFQGRGGSVIVAKKAKVSEFNGKTLSTVNNTLIQIDPEIPEAQKLKGWWERGGSNINPTPLSSKGGPGEDSEVKYLNAITKEALSSTPNHSLTISAKATITQTGKLQIYMACKTCKKKLNDMQNGFLKCDKCRGETNDGDRRLILGFCVSDCTGSTWVSAFHEEAEAMLNKTAAELQNLKEMNEEALQEILTTLHFQTYVMKIRGKMETWKDVDRTRCHVQAACPVDLVDYSRRLLKEINEMAN